MTRGFPNQGGRHGDDGLKIGRNGLKEIEAFIDTSIEVNKPFFVWYAPFLPHTPHNPPTRLLKKYAPQMDSVHVAKYYAMCEWFDETCGQLVGILEDRNLRDNTIIVYVCDNGWIQNPNGKRYALRSKQSAYEGGVRTLIMFSWPEKFQPSDRSELCSSLDILPTVVSAAGGRIPAGLPGLNLTPALESGQKILRNQLFGESFAHDIANIEDPEASLLFRWTIQDQWKLLLTYDGKIGRYKSTHPRDIPGPQLFNLKEDPMEKKNLAAIHPLVVKKLDESIRDWYPLNVRKTMDQIKE